MNVYEVISNGNDIFVTQKMEYLVIYARIVVIAKRKLCWNIGFELIVR